MNDSTSSGRSAKARVDVVDLGPGREAQLDERLDLLAEHGVVEDRRVAADDADLLEPVDPPLGGRRRQTDQAPDLAGRAPAVLDEQLEDPLVELVEVVRAARNDLIRR